MVDRKMLSLHRANNRGNNGERSIETAQQSRDGAKSPLRVYRASIVTVDRVAWSRSRPRYGSVEATKSG